MVHFGDRPRHEVGRGEHDVDRIPIEPAAAPPGGVEQRFHLVGQPLEDDQPHHGGVALERMEATKQRGQGLTVIGSRLERHRRLLDLGEQFFGFGGKEPHHLRVGAGGQYGHRLKRGGIGGGLPAAAGQWLLGRGRGGRRLRLGTALGRSRRGNPLGQRPALLPGGQRFLQPGVPGSQPRGEIGLRRAC